MTAFCRLPRLNKSQSYAAVNHSFGPRRQKGARNVRVRTQRGLTNVTTRRVFGLTACLLAIAAPATGFAAPTIALDSAVFVERTTPDSARSLEPAQDLSPGDRLVYLVKWHRLGGSGGFVVTNPLPRSVYFQSSANGNEEVSIDGGRSWGKLANLRIGARIATPEDVTHVRWRVAPATAAKGSGRIAYSAIVR